MSAPTSTRRTVLARTAAAVSAGGLAAVGVGYATSSAAVAVAADDEFVADDVSIERNDGEVDAVTVAPELEVAWRNFGGGLQSIDVTLSAAIEGDAGFDVLLDTAVGESDGITVDGDDLGSVDGTADLVVDRRDLTEVGDDVSTADFGGDLAPGGSTITTVELTLRVDVVGSQGDSETAFETVTFDVTVHNPEGEASATGRAHTDAE